MPSRMLPVPIHNLHPCAPAPPPPPKMHSITTKITSQSISRLLSHAQVFSRCLSSPAATETRRQKLERIADELIDLNRIERYDYKVLLAHKFGYIRYGSVPSGIGAAGSPASSAAAESSKPAEEKTAFDIKLEKFDAAAKIKIIKEVRTFTDLGLKEAKDLVEKAPVVIKKGVVKEEASAIVEKLKELGATVVLE